MFKSNLSPLNPKDKYSNNNFPQPNNEYQTNQNYHQSTYQYTKSPYANNAMINQRHQAMTPTQGYVPLSPLSPNISKNPVSPTAKIKMFSNTLTLNKKNSLSNGLYQGVQYQNTQENMGAKQGKMFGKMGVKNLVFDMTDEMDLKCDEVLQEQEFVKVNYRRETPQAQVSTKQNTYARRTSTKIPLLNFQNQMDDLKCDQVLDIKKTQHNDQGKLNLKFNNPTQQLSNQDVQNNFVYTNLQGKIGGEFSGTMEKFGAHGPLTPNYQRKRNNPLIMRKNNDRDYHQNNSSNTSLNSQQPQSQLQQEKARSFTPVISPHQNRSPQNQEQTDKLQNQNNPSSQFTCPEKSVQNMQKCLQRTNSLLQAYKKKLDEMQEKNVFLEKQNLQLRKCLYDEGASKQHGQVQNHVSSAVRYQGGK